MSHASPHQRFAEKTKADPGTGCLEWIGWTYEGYGVFSINDRNVRVHRWAWEQAHGPIPPGMFVHHKCHNRRCVNVAHLDLATPRENTIEQDSMSVSAKYLRRTHCRRGHRLGGLNSAPNRRGRQCLQCQVDRNRSRQWGDENKAARLSRPAKDGTSRHALCSCEPHCETRFRCKAKSHEGDRLLPGCLGQCPGEMCTTCFAGLSARRSEMSRKASTRRWAVKRLEKGGAHG